MDRARRAFAVLPIALVVLALAGQAGSARSPTGGSSLVFTVRAPDPGNASLYQWQLRSTGDVGLLRPSLPPGSELPAGMTLTFDLYPEADGIVAVNALIINSAAPRPASVQFRLSAPARKSLAAGAPERLYSNINRWPRTPPAACRTGGKLAKPAALVPAKARTFTYVRTKPAKIVVASPRRGRWLKYARSYVCDVPTASGPNAETGLPRVDVDMEILNRPSQGPVRVHAFWRRHKNVPAPTGLLLTSLPEKPVPAGSSAGSCVTGSRGAENYVLCKPPAGGGSLTLDLEFTGSLPPGTIADVKAAAFFGSFEYGPFRTRSRRGRFSG